MLLITSTTTSRQSLIVRVQGIRTTNINSSSSSKQRQHPLRAWMSTSRSSRQALTPTSATSTNATPKTPDQWHQLLKTFHPLWRSPRRRRMFHHIIKTTPPPPPQTTTATTSSWLSYTRPTTTTMPINRCCRGKSVHAPRVHLLRMPKRATSNQIATTTMWSECTECCSNSRTLVSIQQQQQQQQWPNAALKAAAISVP